MPDSTLRITSPRPSSGSDFEGGSILTLRRAIEITLIALIAIAFRLPHLDYSPSFDELYHLLAAQSWAEEGTLRVGDGAYRRAAPYSMGLGEFFRIAGVSVNGARLFSVAAGVAWCVAFFVWMRLVTGALSAWIGGLLFLTAPGSIFLSSFIRFYAWHGLFFLLGTIGAYAVLSTPLPRRAFAASLSLVVVSFLIASTLQITTLIGLAGIAVWVGIETSRRLRRIYATYPWMVIGLIGLTIGLLVVVLTSSSFIDDLWARYRWRALWAGGSSDPRRFFWIIGSQYPAFLSFLPVATLVAIKEYPRPALLAATVFGASFLTLSFGGMQAEKYLYFAMPMFFALWGIALAASVPFIGDLARRTLGTVVSGQPSRWASNLFVLVCYLVVGVGIVAGNPGFTKTVRMAQGRVVQNYDGGADYWHRPTCDWSRSQEHLQSLADKASVVVTTNGLAALYYLGDYDIEISPAHLFETRGQTEFSIDGRTGRPILSSTDSLEQVLRCNPQGLVISSGYRFRNSTLGISEQMAEFLEMEADRIEIQEDEDLVVFWWAHPTPGNLAECPPGWRRELEY